MQITLELSEGGAMALVEALDTVSEKHRLRAQSCSENGLLILASHSRNKSKLLANIAVSVVRQMQAAR